MIDKKVIDDRGIEYTLIQFIVHDGKIKGMLQTANGQFWAIEYQKLKTV